jgi:manganese transport system ATP-binding protein
LSVQDSKSSRDNTSRLNPAAGQQFSAGQQAHPSEPAPSIEVRNLTVHYGEVLALADASVSLHPGVVCGLIGVNGSGKSTLFKAIMGLVKPDAGTVRVNGQPPLVARRSGAVGYVPQSEAVDWAFPISVEDVVMMGRYGRLGLTRRPRRADREAVVEALRRVDLLALAQRPIGALSGGQKKRAFVARGLAQEASILLLDEPFAGVDKRSEATITELLREVAARGCTVLVSTHDLSAVPALCDEAILFNRRVLLRGTPDLIVRPESLALAFGGVPGGGALPAERSAYWRSGVSK